jgi:hypothetical protein
LHPLVKAPFTTNLQQQQHPAVGSTWHHCGQAPQWTGNNVLEVGGRC